MTDMNYRLSAIEKINRTQRILEKLTDEHPEDLTLRIFAEEIINRMGFMNETLQSWYRDGIEEKWDAETIHVGKAACIGNIDALELLTKDIKSRLN